MLCSKILCPRETIPGQLISSKECTDYKVISVSVWSRLRPGDLQTGGQGTVCVGTGSRRLRPGIPQRQVNYPVNLQLALTKKNAFSVTPAIQTEHVP